MSDYIVCIRTMFWVPLLGLALLASPALAVDNLGLFELDGNAVDVPAGAPDDWDTPPDSGGAFVFTGITTDVAPASIFTGGRKDIQPISQWGHKNGAVPDKDDITNAYAAAYNDAGHLIVYFGADRFANVGDAFLGFWFFADKVAALPDGSFDGAHTTQDTLVLVDYPQGANTMPTVSVLTWDPSCSKAANNSPGMGDCAAKNLKLIFDSAGALCAPAGSDDVCAITNTSSAPAPWAYTPKAGMPGTFPPESFFEGGIDLTEIIGDVCFSSFMAETRSSKQFTASLKDFVLDEFEVCGISITKVCDTAVVDAAELGFDYTFSGVVTNDGIGTLYDVVVTDVTGNQMIPLGNITAGNSVPYNGTFNSTTNGIMNTVTVAAAPTSGGARTVTDGPVMAQCPQVSISPMMSVDKDCNTNVMVMGGKVVVNVNFSGMVCNTSDQVTPISLSNVFVTEDPDTPMDASDDQVFNIGSLAPGACAPYSGSYLPGIINSTDPGLVMFMDNVEAVGTAPLGFGTATASSSATCPLCPPPD